MENEFLWLGFLGAWFLFAGPIYQAVLDLRSEDIELDRIWAIRATGSKLPKQPKVSMWWWLIPPVKLYKDNRRAQEQRIRVIKLLTPEDTTALITFKSKAIAWLYVAFGGLCIACKETYELAHHYEWDTSTLLLLLAGMFTLCIVNLGYQLKRAANIYNI